MGVEWPLGEHLAIEMGENSGCVLKMGVKNTARGTGGRGYGGMRRDVGKGERETATHVQRKNGKCREKVLRKAYL